MTRIQYDECDRCKARLPGTGHDESFNDRQPRVHLKASDTKTNGSRVVADYHYDLCKKCREEFVFFMHNVPLDTSATTFKLSPYAGLDGET